MAGFFKKIFSFGKKEIVEERIDETAPLPPIKWDALDALKPAAEPAPHPPPEGEGRREAAGRGDSADASASAPPPPRRGRRRRPPPLRQHRLSNRLEIEYK
ncbi:hypothetical protein LB568_29525, partial [Mesorhizobium sp. B263B2A]|nr:hypothetical protein [Mesorhizobium sp. B263B2A]